MKLNLDLNLIIVYIGAMRKIFIADAHLRGPEDPNYRALIRFLHALPADTETLYLLGDLFEFWIGYPDPVYRHYREVIASLEEVRRRGIDIVYFEGNHDFHLGRFFRERLQAEVHAEGAVLEIGGRKVYLCHGDQVNRHDRRYLAFRRICRSPVTKALVPLVSSRLVSRTASVLSSLSSSRHAERRVRWDYPELIRSFARERYAAGCHAVITGHFHLPFLERSGGHVLLSLGDWITQFSYGQWLDGEFSLESFR